MAPRISQPPVARSAANLSSNRGFVATGTFVPKQVWGEFSPLKLLQFDGQQFTAHLKTGEALRGLFEFTVSASNDTLTLVGAMGPKLTYTVDDMTLGRHNELTSLRLCDAGAKKPPFSLFLKRA